MIFTLRSTKPTDTYEADAIAILPDSDLTVGAIYISDGEVTMTCTGPAYIVPRGHDIIQIETSPK